MRKLLLICISLIVTSSLSAQKSPEQSSDSVRVKGRSFLILGDSSIYVENDTIFVLPDSVAAKLKRDETTRSDEFYIKLKNKFYKTRFTKELYKILFNDVSSANTQSKPKPAPIISNGNYAKYKGRPINRIRIKKLEVFGTRITDTLRHYDSWAINIANDLHVYTRSRIIRNALFFEEGEAVNPDALADSERILRTLPYIKDARIYVIAREGQDEVEILVIVKDIWSITGDVDFSSFSKSNVAIIDENFLGLGQEFRNEFLYNNDNKPKIGYNGTYKINNIESTFITGELNYASSEPLDRIGVNIYRNFITPEIKYAGGIEVSKTNIRLERVFPDTVITFFTQFNKQDLWLGRSWLISESNDGSRINVHLGGRFERLRYLDRPVVEKDTNQQFFDRNLHLFSLGISKRGYEKSSLILGYGRTEDIPNGYLLEFTAGKENNEYHKRTYLGWRLSIGQYYGRLGYIRPSFELGGFVRKGHVDQGALRLRTDYFSPLYRINKLNFRQFFRFGYTLGINRYDNEFININNRNGIRGLNYVFLRGTRKLSFSSETIAFTPFYIIGFRFAAFAFADLAIVNDVRSKLLTNKLYQGYGLGLRLRNENLAINTIQISFTFYPVTPPDVSSTDLELSGQSPLNIPDFRIEEPDVIPFE